MTDPKDPKPGPKPDSADPQEPASAAEGKRSGRVGFDARGNSVWEWQLETGVYSRDVNTQKLKKLDLGDLSIAETAIQQGPLGLEEDKPPPGGGFNPYNNAARPKQEGFNPYDNARNVSKKLTPEPDVQKKRAPLSLDELRKLSEAIKLKRKLGKD